MKSNAAEEMLTVYCKQENRSPFPEKIDIQFSFTELFDFKLTKKGFIDFSQLNKILIMFLNNLSF